MAEADPAVVAAREHAELLLSNLEQVVLGQRPAIRQMLVGVLADGHVLLEGVPGVAKTLLARALAKCLGIGFSRVQFTPDLMPSDLVGTRVWNAESREWEVHKGPIFTEVLLADEINRTPPKTQAALLEAMEERQVTLDGEANAMADAFFVIATENPLEFEGTYPLPEAQTDRFLLKIVMGYPDEEAELLLLTQSRSTNDRLDTIGEVLSREDLLSLRSATASVKVSESVASYALALLRATRASEALKLGASPRSGLMLLSAARAEAVLSGRDFVLPDDVKAVIAPVLRHRLALSTEAELDGLEVDHVLDDILAKTPVREDADAAPDA